MRKNRLTWLALAVAVLSLGVGWWALSEGQRPAEEPDPTPQAAEGIPAPPRPAGPERPSPRTGTGLSGQLMVD
jgi:hypothetical protein